MSEMFVVGLLNPAVKLVKSLLILSLTIAPPIPEANDSNIAREGTVLSLNFSLM